jgi:AGZA family xanthine/uracil permease-like MFS transporter
MNRLTWLRQGDVNAFFGLMLDNLAVMIILVSSVSVASVEEAAKGEVKFTSEFVLTRMIPGTALGVLLGDLVYTVMAFRLARRTGHTDVTAMPLGLDTPSTFGVAYLVLLPTLKDGFARFDKDHTLAMEFAWHVGLAVLVIIGLVKLGCAPLGNLVRKWVPRAGLLGSLAAIALVLIAFLPMLTHGIAAVPLVGMVSLLVILLTLVAHRQLPFRFPGALAAVLLGIGLYQFGIWLGRTSELSLVPPPKPAVAASSGGSLAQGIFPFAGKDFEWWGLVLGAALAKLPVILPFALATIVGGIDCTESAAAAGDEYDTRSVLLTEGVASVAAGLLGGVIQTTPYIGHPAYKKMGGGAGYTLATALFIGAAGCFGWFAVFYNWLPEAAMFPILVFVGLEITAQSFLATPTRHYPALAFAVLPALAFLITIPLNTVLAGRAPVSPDGFAIVQTLRCLANGFLITSLLWGAALAMILDGKLVRAASYFGIAALCTLFGIIHSPLAPEKIDLPQNVVGQVTPDFAEAVRFQTPYHWAGAYGLLVVVLLLLVLLQGKVETTPEKDTSLVVSREETRNDKQELENGSTGSATAQ